MSLGNAIKAPQDSLRPGHNFIRRHNALVDRLLKTQEGKKLEDKKLLTITAAASMTAAL